MKHLFSLIALLIFNLISYSQNYVSTYAGTGVQGFTNGAISSCTFNQPFGMCRDRSGNFFICDANNCIRKIEFATGITTTYAGTGIAGYRDGAGDTAQFNLPSDLCVDDSGNVYVSDFLNQRIRKIDINRNVTTIAGNGNPGYANGFNAQFNYPRGICIDRAGNLYVADSWNHRIRKIDPMGNVTTIAGGGMFIGVGSTGMLTDAHDTASRFWTPSGLAMDQRKNIYVADAYNHRIRMIDSSLNVTTIIGSGAIGNGSGAYHDGPFNSAVLNTPTELFYDTLSEALYISDTFNNRIRIADFFSSMLSTYAGDGLAGFMNGLTSLARFDYPRGIVVDSNQIIYVCDFNNNVIRKIGMQNNGIPEYQMDAIQLYPNPAKDLIHIQNPNNENYLFILTDVSGKMIFNIFSADKEFIYDLSFLNQGIYLLKMIGENSEVKTFKIVH